MKVLRSYTGVKAPILTSLFSVLLISYGCTKKSSDPAVAADPIPEEETGSLKLSSVAPYISIVSPVSGESESASLTEDEEAAKLDETDPQVLKENLQTLFGAAETVEDCLVGVDRTQAANNGPSCYGPSVFLTEHHPDGTWPGADANSWNLPGGDLGIWSADQDGEACTAAKMNSLIETLRQQAQSGIEAALRAGCIARVLEKTLPTTVGEELDLLEDVNTAITEAEIDNFSFSTLTITLEASDETLGNVYTTVLAAETPNADIWTKVSQRRESDTKTSGYIWTTTKAKSNPALSGPPPAGDQSYVTSVFFKEDGDNLSYEATRSRTVDATEEQAMEADPTVMFDTDKRVRMADSSNPGYDHIITEMNTATGAGETVYLWTAGGKMEEQRVMHAIVEVEGETKSATGYFGFGKSLNDMRALVKAGTVTATTPSIEGMICNWAGPGNSHDTVAFVQKQVMEFDAETGLFAASTNKISYQPSKLCGEGADKDTNFKYALPDNNNRPADGEFAAFADFDLQDISSGEDKDALVMPELISIDF